MIRAFGIVFLLAEALITMYGYDNCPALLEQCEYPQALAGKKSNNKNKEKDMETNQIKLTVNDRSFIVTLAKNTSAEALKKHLAQKSISIRVHDYDDMEKVGSLGFSLPRNDMHTTTKPGDIILYQGNYIVFYYDTNSWNFTRLGQIDGISSRREMLDLLGGKGEVTVTLSL